LQILTSEWEDSVLLVLALFDYMTDYKAIVDSLDLFEAVKSRHSVRKYLAKPIDTTILDVFNYKIGVCNREGSLHVQLVTGEPKAFTGLFAYGKFYGVENYLVMAGPKSADLDYRVGYYGEQLVLIAQALGLNTCWAGLSYRKVAGVYDISEGEKIACMIALGYGESSGVTHKSKSVAQVSNAGSDTPQWFLDGVEAALLAPTAVNQQKFSFRYVGPASDGRHRVVADKGFSMIGYTQMDLGIAKLHFEIGAGIDNFVWG